MTTTQEETILKHLKRSSITQLKAYERYGIFRLAAVIYKLRQKGHVILSEEKMVKNRTGSKSRIAVYRYGHPFKTLGGKK
jgi:hypothetical protein